MSDVFEIFVQSTEDADTRHTRCPACGKVDTIVEVDTAVRWNTLTLSDDLTATASTGDGDWEGTGFLCSGCMTEVDAPEGFQIVDWS